MDVPYVTFTLQDNLVIEGESVHVLKAIECYKLNDKEAKTVRTGDVWRTGFMLPTGAVLSSSPIGSYQKDNESKLLLFNTDVRLRSTLQWGRVRLSAREPNVVRWIHDVQYLDDTIQFEINIGKGAGAGVQNVELSRIERQFFGYNKYRVVRHRSNWRSQDPAPAKRLVLLEHMPIDDEYRSRLDDSYWGLNPYILGEVIDSLMILKYWLIALLCAL